MATLLLMGWATPVRCQTTASSDSSGDETIKLSPFVVGAAMDHGYVATSSMAGTRLNTSLKEIPASISTVTKDMMNDLGAYNSQELLTYTLGTEVSGPYGSFSGASVAPGTLAQDYVDRSFAPLTRVRGLAPADNTRDFFLTSIPWDGFNTDRVEINRGPNAMLFGTGSPAGIINQTTILPEFGKSANDVTFEYGRFGSARAQLDNNTVLLHHQLAIRTALKYSNDRFMQREAHIRDKRAFIAVAYRPYQLTTIRANFEEGRQESVKPEWRPPFDLGITHWFDLGKPAYDPTTGQTTLTGTWNQQAAPVGALNPDGSTNHNLIRGSGAFGSDFPNLIFTQPDQLGIVGPALYTNAFAGGLAGVQAITNRGPGNIALQFLPDSRTYEVVEHAGQVGGSNYNEQEISDPRIFDFYHHALDGQNKPEGAIWHVGTVSLEQLLPDRNGGIALDYHSETVHSSFSNAFNGANLGLGVDINTKLLDGSPNPNFGRPLFASSNWTTETLEKRTDKRATAFYTFELKDTGPEWLRRLVGTHTLTGNIDDSTYYTVTTGGRTLVAGPEWVLENPNVAADAKIHTPPIYTITNGAQRQLDDIVYVGNSTAGDNAYGMNIQPVTVNVLIPGYNYVPATFFDPTTHTWKQTAISVIRGAEFDKSAIDLDWTGGAVKSESLSKVAILHSKMLDGVLLPTLGYREDSLKFWNAPSDLYLPGNFAETKAPLPSSPTSTMSQSAFNWGAVVRLPRRLQRKLPWGLDPEVFFNKSDNFSPSGRRLNILGAPIAPEGGNTKESGVILGGLGGRLSLRWTHYETSLTGVSQDRRDANHALLRDGASAALSDIESGNSANLAGNAAAAAAFMNWYNKDPLAAQLRSFYGDSLGVTYDGSMYQTADTVAKGDELELTFNPLSNWRIATNWSTNQVTTQNSSADAYQLLNAIQPTLQGLAGQVWVNAATHVTWQQQAQLFVNTISADVAQDGQSANPELRKHHFNVLTNYTFSEGWLKGIGVGGAVRWASKILIGTGFVHSTQLGRDVPDYSRPYYGPGESRYDAWISYRKPNLFRHVNWSLQLNVRNLGVGEKLVPVVAQPDGSIAQWRIAEPMTWTLRSSFDF